MVFVAPGSAQSIVWTGGGADNNWTNGANWEGGVAPTTGSDVSLGSMRRYRTNLNAPVSINSLIIDRDYHEFGTDSGATLTIGAGGLTNNGDTVYFDSSLGITLGASQTWFVDSSCYSDEGRIEVGGTLTVGSGVNLTKTGGGVLALSGDNSLTIGSTSQFILSGGTLALGHDNALGGATGATLTINADSTIESLDADRSLANPLVLNTGNVYLQTHDGKLTFTGPVTLSTSSTIAVEGPNPVVLTGAVSESAPEAGYILSKTGSGTLVMQGAIGITGGASINEGRVILDAADAIPLVPGAMVVNSGAYVGTTVSTFSAGASTRFIDRFTTGSSGAIGFDTNTPASPYIVTDPIDLTGFSSLHLGSSTAATFTSSATITPEGDIYKFGGGGGLLRVESDLTDNPTTSMSRSIVVESSSGQALSLVLAGNNNYGDVTIDNSVLRFTNSAAFRPAASITINNQGYLGFDYDVNLAALSLSSLVSGAGTFIYGIDSPNPASPRSVSLTTDDLYYLPSDTFLGTSTAATLEITPGEVIPATLSLAAVKEGHLTVSSLPSDIGTNTYSVTIGLWNNDSPDSSPGAFASWKSTVTLASANTYTGGTTLQGGRLELGAPTALGTGDLTVYGNVVLATTTAGLTIANTINIPGYHDLLLDSGALNSYTLSGAISGSGALIKEGTGTVQLSGPVELMGVEGPADDHEIWQGTLDILDTFTTDGRLRLYDSTTVNFGPSVSATIGGLESKDAPAASSVINLDTGATLTINQTGWDDDNYYSGAINGSGSLVKTGDGMQLLGSLPGPSASNYSGGTTITGGALVAMSNGALGTGPVTVNVAPALAPEEGGLGVYTDVTLTNSLTFTRGVLAGYGTFAPPGGVTVGSTQLLWPGNLFESDPVGVLGFGTGLTLASGGTYMWESKDAVGTAGITWDLLKVTGSLTITSTEADPFYLKIMPAGYYEAGGEIPPPEFNNTLYYDFVIATATGGISGFDPAFFSLDWSSFGSSVGIGQFFLTQEGNDLVLHFTPIPEPSTSALLGLGLAGMLAGWLRRRRG
ncbi:MAG: autotransporter-associated beta strand repeat-containing protein [Opitutaceae bacterium]|nr:autotransporter-associated beta strand repeat-containing protein [Opitutaceae bacterium]